MTESGFRNMECSDEVRTAVAFPNVGLGLGSLLHPVPWVSVDSPVLKLPVLAVSKSKLDRKKQTLLELPLKFLS